MLRNIPRVAVAALFCAAALATPAIGGGLIDFTPMVDQALILLNPMLVAVVTVLGAYLAALIKKKTGIDLAIMQQGDNAMLHNGIQRGIDALEREARARILRDGRLAVNVRSPVVATIANRMIVLSPDLLKRMNVTEDRLKELVVEGLTAKLINNKGT